jgi:hypothetical protein
MCVHSSVEVVEGACVRNCRGIGLCSVGTVSQSAGGKCGGGRYSEVKSRRKRRGGDEDRTKEWMKRGRKKLGGEQWIVV